MPANDRAVEQPVTFLNSPPLALPMRTHDNQAPSFQPQPGAITSHAATPHRPEGTFLSQAIAASPTNPFPRRPHEVYMGEPVAARKPVAQAETRTAPESRTTYTEWLQFRLTAPGQPESDLPPWHSGLTMRALQRSPSALDQPWREMQSTSTIGQPQDRSEQETDPVATPITTLSESAQPLQRQEEAGEAEDAGEEEKELQPKRLGEFSQPLVQRRVDVEAATFGEGEDAGGGDRTQRQFNLYAPGQAPPDLPQRHGTQARWALQRSPVAAEPYWYRGQPLQAKLTVGQPNDAYEQEADRVAEQVMSMALPATPNVQRQMEEEEPEAMQMKPLAETITPLVQRQGMLEEQEPLQANCEDCEQEKPIQRSADGVPQVQPDLESRLNASQGGGSALPDEVRSFMEPRFGADFSQVRVHTGSEAMQMNRDLNAQAFTHKQDVYFGAGKNPAKDALTAHELTHVVQQAGTVHAKQTDELLKGQRKEHQLRSAQVIPSESRIQRESPKDNGSESTQVNVQDWEKVIPDLPEGWKIKIVPAPKGGKPTTQVTDSKGKPITNDAQKTNGEENQVEDASDEQKKIKDLCKKIEKNREGIHDRLLSLAGNKVGYMYTAQQDKPTGAADEYRNWLKSAKPEQVGKDPQGRVKLQWELWQDIGNEGDPSSMNTYDTGRVTQGRGFASSGKQLQQLLQALFETAPQVKEDFFNAGIKLEGGQFVAVDIDRCFKARGINAESLIRVDKKLISLFVETAQNTEHRQKALDSQWKQFTKKGGTGDMPPEAEKWSRESRAVAGHNIHKGSFTWASFKLVGDLKGVVARIGRTLGTHSSNGAVFVSSTVTKDRLMTLANKYAMTVLDKTVNFTDVESEENNQCPIQGEAGHVYFAVPGKPGMYYDLLP